MNQCQPIRVHGKPLSGGSVPIIITPLVGKTRAMILDEVAAIVPKKPDLLEWRVDFFESIADVAAVLETARAIRQACAGIPVLFTRRHQREGGTPIAMAEAAVVATYAAVCQGRCVEMIDYELSNDPADLKHLREVSAANDITMIMSYHNFQLTPDADTLDRTFADAERLGADVAKVAVMPSDAQDVLALLAATDRARQTLSIPLISMSMGGVGSLSRIMGWVYGSAATFAVGQTSSAPGQIAIEDLRTVLAIMQRAVAGH